MSLPPLRGAGMALAVALQLPSGPPARVSTGVIPDTVTVGDRFRSLVRVHAPPGARVTFPALPAGDSLQMTGPAAARLSGAGEPTAVYPLVAWVAGAPLAAVVPVRVELADGTASVLRVRLPLPVVRSVLPADTAGLEPRPPKGLLPVPATGERGRIGILAAAVAAALLGIGWLARRLRSPKHLPPRDPREVALERLERLRASGLLERGEFGELYTRATRIVRGYVAAVEARWGEDLTTTELLAALAGSAVPPRDVQRLRELLADADAVKFAGVQPGAPAAERFLASAREWVASARTEHPPEREVAA